MQLDSYSFNQTTSLVTFNTSTNHGFTIPLRGTQVTISGLTGSLATAINSKLFDVYSIPTSTSFTILLVSGAVVTNSSRTNGVATLTTAAAHGFSSGQTVLISGAGTDPIDSSLTYDGTQTLISGTTGSTLVYNNNPKITASPTSMYIDASTNQWSIGATNSIRAVFNKVNHGFTSGQYLTGDITTYANASITDIGFTSDTQAFLKLSTSIANVYAVNMGLSVNAPTLTEGIATTTGSYTYYMTYYQDTFGTKNTYGNRYLYFPTLNFNSIPIPSTAIDVKVQLYYMTRTSTYTGTNYSIDVPRNSVTKALVWPVEWNGKTSYNLGSGTSYIYGTSGTQTVTFNNSDSYKVVVIWTNLGNQVSYGGNFTGQIQQIIDANTIMMSRSGSYTALKQTADNIYYTAPGSGIFTKTGSNVSISFSITSKYSELDLNLTDGQDVLISDRYGVFSPAVGVYSKYQVVVSNSSNFTITTTNTAFLTALASTGSHNFSAIVPIRSVGAAVSNTSYKDKKTYTNAPVTVVNADVFNMPITTQATNDLGLSQKFTGYFGNSSAPITVTSGTLTRNTDKSATVVNGKAVVATITTTSVSGVTASSNFSSFVEIANTSDAIKMTPRTFYIGNTTANLYSNSSFLGISSADSLFEATPSYLFLGKAINGVPTLGAGSYVYANSTNLYVGNATKYTVFDGAGNQIIKGSSITITNDAQTTYIDDNSISLTSDSAQTSINPYSAQFGGNVAIAGPLAVQNTYGNTGDMLYSDGLNAYWGPTPTVNTDIVYAFTNNISFGRSVSFDNAISVANQVVVVNSSISIVEQNNSIQASLSTSQLTLQYDQEFASLDAGTLSIQSGNGFVYIGNSTVNSTINATSFTGTANNALYLGTTPAASYVNTSGNFTLSGVITHSGNVIIGTSAALKANDSFGTAGQILKTTSTGVYWADAPPSTTTREIYTADGSTNTFTVVAGYSSNNLDVFMNGVKLQNGYEVTATNGTTFTITTGNPAAGTIIEVVGGAVIGMATAVPYTTATASSVTINPYAYSGYFYTALASTLTINASTAGTPVNGTRMIFRFKDNGTARTLTWATTGAGSFRVIGTNLPTSTTQGKVTYVACIYNADEQYWDVVAVGVQS
jgi:hypothetical protein